MGGLISRNFNPADIQSLNGKVVVVTGGNRGIGYATVKHLARAGAKVYIASRNETTTATAIEQMKKDGLEPGNGDVLWFKLDLSDPREAKRSAEEFLSKETRLDILINNAGILSSPYSLTSDGLSDIVVVNYISPFVFTETLLPLLQTTARQPDSDVRIVNVASVAHFFTPHCRFADIKDLNVQYRFSLAPAFLRYCHSKLLSVMWTKSLQRRLDIVDPPAPITVLAVHPGGVDTFSHNWPFARFWKVLVRVAIADIDVGAYNSVFAAASPKVKQERDKFKGVYLASMPTGRITKASSRALDPDLCERLWNTTEACLKDIGLTLQ